MNTTHKPTLEEIADGKLFHEKEIETYVRITNFEQLKKASSVDRQEQWSIRVQKTNFNNACGNIRVRKVDVGGDGSDVKYILTTKVILGKGDRAEVGEDSSKDMFDLFKHMSDSGMVKDRYHFPVPGTKLVFEVDLFIQEDGEYAPWVKIDLENCTGPMPELPIEVVERIDGSTNDPKLKARITEIYDKYFIRKNVYKAI